MIGPTDVGVRTRGVFWVTDSGNSRIVRVDTPIPFRLTELTVGGDVSIDASPPMDVDPIFDPRAVVAFGNQPATSPIRVESLADFAGFVTIAANLLTNAPVTPTVPQLYVSGSPVWVPTDGVAATNLLITSIGAQPGKFVAKVTVADLARTFAHDVKTGFEVLPPWPADGPAPACQPVFNLLTLSTLDLYSWRQKFPPSMPNPVYSAGVSLIPPAISSRCPNPPISGKGCNGPAGFALALQGSGGVALRSDQAQINIIDDGEGSGTKQVSTSNSGNCAAPNQTVILPSQQNTTLITQLNISKADTTTLFLSGSHTSPVAFSEGPFWAFFGGRRATIAFVGDW